jgi:PleD family two-component response regulator
VKDAGTSAGCARRHAAPSASGSTVFLRFSAGIAERHADESLAQALERADAALLDAKRQGKATVALSIQPTQSAPAATADACN